MRITVAKSTWDIHSRGRVESATAKRILCMLLGAGTLPDDRDLPVEVVLPVRVFEFSYNEYRSFINSRLAGALSPLRLSRVYCVEETTVLVVAPTVGLGSLCD